MQHKAFLVVIFHDNFGGLVRCSIVIRIVSVAFLGLTVLISHDIEIDYRQIFSSTKVYNVAILPICNPGMPCDPKIPERLEQNFFRHQRGVATFIYETLNGHAVVKGLSTPWLRAKSKLKSIGHVLAQSESLIRLAKDHIRLADFDIIYLYTNVSNKEAMSDGWPAGQLITIDTQEISPAIAFIFNTEALRHGDKRMVESTVLPSIHWAHEFLHVIGR